MATALATFPTEILLCITDHLGPVSRYCLSITCRCLHQVIGLKPGSFNKCERWHLMTRLERDLAPDRMPRKLACCLCKCKRHVRDFGYKKPLIEQRSYQKLRRIPLISSLLHHLPSFLNLNIYSLAGIEKPEQWQYSPSTRSCYRHDHLWYSSLEEKSKKTIPRIRKHPQRKEIGDPASWATFQMLSCGHCGRLMEEDDDRVYGCKHCDCKICRNAVKRQVFRIGKGDRPGTVVELIVVHSGCTPGTNSDTLYERGSKSICSCCLANWIANPFHRSSSSARVSPHVARGVLLGLGTQMLRIDESPSTVE